MTGVVLKPIPPTLRHCPRPCQRDDNNPARARGGGGMASGSFFRIPPFLATVYLHADQFRIKLTYLDPPT
jgi:hypothetical protein